MLSRRGFFGVTLGLWAGAWWRRKVAPVSSKAFAKVRYIPVLMFDTGDQVAYPTDESEWWVGDYVRLNHRGRIVRCTFRDAIGAAVRNSNSSLLTPISPASGRT